MNKRYIPLIFMLAPLFPVYGANKKTNVAVNDNTVYKCQRPSKTDRLFQSKEVENEIERVTKLLNNQKLA